MHRLFVLFSGSVTSPRGRFSADFIMNTAGRSIQQGHRSSVVEILTHLAFSHSLDPKRTLRTR
jgi:hypothetical protein